MSLVHKDFQEKCNIRKYMYIHFIMVITNILLFVLKTEAFGAFIYIF